MYSYMATNGYLQKLHRDFESSFSALRSATSNVGGWDTAVTEARACASLTGADTLPSGSEGAGGDGFGTPNLSTGTLPNGTTRTIIDGDMATALRQRLQDVPKDGANGIPPRTSKEHIPNRNKDKNEPEYAVLTHHPDQEVSGLASQLLDMDDELTSHGELRLRWPENISVGNFATYMLIPTLVYELEYPRTKRYVFFQFSVEQVSNYLLRHPGYALSTYLRKLLRPSELSPSYIR